MKTKHWIAVVVGMVFALALFMGNVQATDDNTTTTDDDTTTTYKFRLENRYTKRVEIRCGSSGSWSDVGIGGSIDKTCSESDAQTRPRGGSTNYNHTHDCSSSDYPVHRLKYTGYYVGLNLRWSISEVCLAS